MVHFLQNRIRNFKLKRGVKINTSTKGSLIIFLAAACYSTGAVLVKFAYMEGLSAMTITMIRMIFAALLTGPIYICYTFRFRLGWKAHIPLLIAGLLNISMSLLLTLALQVLSASVTILLLYLYPIFASCKMNCPSK